MTIKRWLTLFCLCAAAVLVHPPAADAIEPPNNQELFNCGLTFTIGGSCFEIAGDDQWVYDSTRNAPWNTRVQVVTDYGKTRWCTATSAGVWQECLYDHVEDSCLRFRLFEQYGSDNTRTREWTTWTPWFWASTGDICPV